MNRVLRDIERERKRQDVKWGVQSHPNGTGQAFYKEQAKEWREANNDMVAIDQLTWDLILLEEVYEALAEKNVRRLRTELIQVAAVATAWVECLDRKAKKTGAK